MFAINTLMVHFVLIVLFVLTILPQFLINQRGAIEVKSFILLVIEVLAEISSGSISLKRFEMVLKDKDKHPESLRAKSKSNDNNPYF